MAYSYLYNDSTISFAKSYYLIISASKLYYILFIVSYILIIYTYIFSGAHPKCEPYP